MTCNEYTRLVMTRGWAELEEGEALEHARNCPRCSELRKAVEQAQTWLGYAMSAARPSSHPLVLADRAMVGARLRTIEHWLIVVPVLLFFLVLWPGLPALAASAVELLTGHRPLPALTTETIALRCLSGEQARALALPYVNNDRGVRGEIVVGDGSIATLTVRGTEEAVKLTKEVIERFESHPNAACRRR